MRQAFTDNLEGWAIWVSNDHYDFYIKKCGRDWYMKEVLKGTNKRVSMVGCNTRKAAREVAERLAKEDNRLW